MTEAELIALARERGGVIGPSIAESMASEPLHLPLLPTLCPDISEKEFQAQVLSLAEMCGWRCFHPYDSRKSEPGYPDLTCVSAARKRVVWMELKKETGKPTKDQAAWIKELEMAGAEAFVFRPSDWERVMEVLK